MSEFNQPHERERAYYSVVGFDKINDPQKRRGLRLKDEKTGDITNAGRMMVFLAGNVLQTTVESGKNASLVMEELRWGIRDINVPGNNGKRIGASILGSAIINCVNAGLLEEIEFEGKHRRSKGPIVSIKLTARGLEATQTLLNSHIDSYLTLNDAPFR